MRMFLLCCGPSIKYQNLQCIQNEICISVSNFFVHPLIKQINPTQHLFPPMHSPITDKMAIEWFSEADEKLPLQTTVLLDNKDIHLWPKNSNRNITQYNPHTIQYQSVSQIVLNVALQHQPTEIYLLGCDHNWIRHIGETRHFYQSSDSVMERQGYDEWFGQDKEEAKQRELQCNNNLFRIYELYKTAAEQQGTTIYNATPGSRLKVFTETTLFKIFEEPTMGDI